MYQVLNCPCKCTFIAKENYDYICPKCKREYIWDKQNIDGKVMLIPLFEIFEEEENNEEENV